MRDSKREVHRKITRREFVGKTLAGAVAAAGVPVIGAVGEEKKSRRSATDRVQLGTSRVTVTRLAMGSGSMGGSIQRKLGQEKFNRLIRHGWDRGIRFIDTADNYKTHGMIRQAIQGLPREELVLQTKLPWGRFTRMPPGEIASGVQKDLDRFRKELGVEHLDIVLMHNTDRKGWPESLEAVRDALSAAKERGIIRAHGVSVHGLPGLREVARCKWVEVALLRINHNGTHMDGERGAWNEPGKHGEAIQEIQKIHAAGKGIIGMKIIGNGDFTDPLDREKSIQFVLSRPFVNAVDIGFKSPLEIDEAMERINRALNA